MLGVPAGTALLNAGAQELIVVIAPDAQDRAAQALAGLSSWRAVTGGDTRARSVQAGLAALTCSADQPVLIHDAARPCTPPSVIKAVIRALDTHQAAAPALSVTDALWRVDGGTVLGPQSRDGLYRAQTPQGFHFEAIRAAHASHKGAAADDVEVARAAGLKITCSKSWIAM